MVECTLTNRKIRVGQPGKKGIVPVVASLTKPCWGLLDSVAGGISYTDADTIYRLYDDNTEIDVVAADVITTPASDANFTYTVADEVGGNGVLITVTNMNASLDSAYIDILYVYNGVDYRKRFNVSLVTTV